MTQSVEAEYDFTVPGRRRKRRRPSLTPMIDVVFLLLVFFMLASRFGMDVTLPMPLATGGGGYSGPPRLIDILPEGVRLNGQAVAEDTLAAQIKALTASQEDVIILRGGEGTVLQRVVTVAEILRRAGYARLVVLE
ncbi:biopolymer transporter ExbD [Litorivita pollutaquae]|uniref:Biopolymer transporter ExbD n=1 Tax=Litorivita pollutaquae TaxID=2200892 RepID=A0A2V4MXS7_9RHOB|nr:biopolymer transporter ExbD [Litorivita pollutaquae]PYC49108.1 biopolymer transporter ExbD [Litorivita pollutaquae]